ncbi:MAG: hypothetical protein FJY82_00035 [Candidatus Aminicenantes bacterium]|nr:hypothetical protein [Candidatus Aminicenantes bacterium]
MGFDDIAGNARIKAVLRRTLGRGRLPHALLFVGPPGVGKRRTALALAQALNCLERADDACGRCPSCRTIADGRHPDVLEIIRPQVRKNGVEETRSSLGIVQFRELKQWAGLRPLSGKRRVFIWDVGLMSDDAGHAILKVLEEPSPSSTFILLSENPDLVLPTIKSRCQRLVFASVASEEIERILLRRGCPEERARTIALLVRGDLDRALEEDWDLAEKRRAEAWAAFSGLVDGRGGADFIRRWALPRRTKEAREGLAEEIELFRAFSRDLVLLQEAGEPGRLLNPDFETGLSELAGRLAPGTGLRLVEAFDRALTGLERRLNTGLLVSALAARMIG